LIPTRTPAASAPPLHPGDALLLVDVQNDFLPGGALGVADGDEIIAPLNRLLADFSRRELPVFATRDWHPRNHCSFRPQGGPWPPHCIAGTPGAQFPAALALPAGTHVISKATHPGADAYSGFEGTDLLQQLRAAGCTRVYIGGLATDYCVRATTLDALAAGLDAIVLEDAVRAVNLQPEDGARALEEMSTRGARILATPQALA